MADDNEAKTPQSARIGRVQVHLWLRTEDARLLRQLASDRDQTVCAVIRYLLSPFRVRPQRQ